MVLQGYWQLICHFCSKNVYFSPKSGQKSGYSGPDGPDRNSYVIQLCHIILLAILNPLIYGFTGLLAIYLPFLFKKHQFQPEIGPKVGF